MILSAHTPQYLPGLRLLHKIQSCDQFVVLDHLPHQHNSFENRNKIRTSQGWQWLTVPVLHGAPSLAETKIAPGNWARKHFRSLEMNYSRSKYWLLSEETLRNCYADLHAETLSGLAVETMYWLAGACVIPVEWSGWRYSSELRPEGDNWRMVLDLCKKLDADTFLFGALGRDYMDAEAMAAFKKAGVKPLFQKWEVIEYQQAYPGFIGDLSALDSLLNLGGEETRALIERSGRWEE